MNTTELKEYAQLSQAAYAYFDDADFAGRGGTDASMQRKLRTPDKGDFTEQEAKDFSNRYKVLHQFTDSAISFGFSATLFQDRVSGRLVFSIRGTEFIGDPLRDFWVTDLRIGIDGYASTQLIPLYRYFKQLTTGAGQTVGYTTSEISKLETVFFDFNVDNSTTRAQWTSLRTSLFTMEAV